MPKKVVQRKVPVLLIRVLLMILGIAAVAASVLIADPDVVGRLMLALGGAVAFLVSALLGPDGEGDTLGSPRYRRVRAFNPSSRRLRRVKARDVKLPPPPQPDWPKPVLADVPANMPLEQCVEITADDPPFDVDVQQLKVHIETDEPVQICDFVIGYPGEIPDLPAPLRDPPAPLPEIEELIFTVLEDDNRLMAVACVLYRRGANADLELSPPVMHPFPPI
jgi:hypothetical protein